MNMKTIFSDILEKYDTQIIRLIVEKYGINESVKKIFLFRNI